MPSHDASAATPRAAGHPLFPEVRARSRGWRTGDSMSEAARPKTRRRQVTPPAERQSGAVPKRRGDPPAVVVLAGGGIAVAGGTTLSRRSSPSAARGPSRRQPLPSRHASQFSTASPGVRTRAARSAANRRSAVSHRFVGGSASAQRLFCVSLFPGRSWPLLCLPRFRVVASDGASRFGISTT